MFVYFFLVRFIASLLILGKSRCNKMFFLEWIYAELIKNIATVSALLTSFCGTQFSLL